MYMRVLVTASGTGGHLVPAIRLADALKRKIGDFESLFITGERGLGRQLIEQAGYRAITIPARGFERRQVWKNVGVLWALWRSMIQCRKLVDEFKPDVAIGTGGYVTGPVIRAAKKAGVPALIHEQNRQPGLTTRLLAKHADIVCVAFEESIAGLGEARKVIVTGNPIDTTSLSVERYTAAEMLGVNPDRPTVLVTGGSQGAESINNAVARSLDIQSRQDEFQLVWQTGNREYDRFRDRHIPDEGVWVFSFINRMADSMAAVDLVISRSGALTLAEITARGIPALLIPYPFAAADHQTTNAQAMADAGAAEMIGDDKLPNVDILERAALIIDNQGRLIEMSACSKKLGRPEATDLIVEHILELANWAA